MGSGRSPGRLRTARQSGFRLRATDRRSAKRVPVNLVAIFVWGGLARGALVTDLSMGGLYAEIAEQPEAYAPVTVVLQHASGGLRLAGVVRWTEPHGMGVQLGSMGPRETYCLAALLARARGGG